MKLWMMVCGLCVLCTGCDSGTSWPSPDPAVNTAAHKLDEVNTLAESYGMGLRLVTVKSESVRSDGTADAWQYRYTDTSLPPTSYWFHANTSAVAFDSTSPAGVGAAVITHRWFNSDAALGIAEQNGGSQFRKAYPRCTISASVGEPVVPDPTTWWWIRYHSDGDNTQTLSFTINAESGVATTRYY